MKKSVSHWLKRHVGVVVAGLFATAIGSAEGASRATVLVLGAEGAPLTGRLRAEIEALGLHVVTAIGGDISPTELAERARAAGAAVAVSTAETTYGVELWLVDRVTGKTLLREVLVRELSSSDPDSVIALRAVELLRASLLELELDHPPRGEVAPTPDLRETVWPAPRDAPNTVVRPKSPKTRPEPASTNESALLAAVGASMLAHPGQAAIVPGLTAAALWQPTRRVAVGLWGTVPFVSSTVSAEEGVAEIGSSAFGTGLRVAPLSPGAWLSPSLGLGASALWLRVEGVEAGPNLVTDSAQLVAAGPYGEIGCALEVVRGLVLHADVRALAVFPRPIVKFAGREVAVLGRPFIALTLGLEYRAVLSASRD